MLNHDIKKKNVFKGLEHKYGELGSRIGSQGSTADTESVVRMVTADLDHVFSGDFSTYTQHSLR